MKRLALSASLIAMAACTTPVAQDTDRPIADGPAKAASATAAAPQSAVDALDAYYATISTDALPKAGKGAEFNEAASVTRVLMGSCNNEERDNPVFRTMAGEEANLLLMLGDNVYGDRDDVTNYVNYDVELAELREGFQEMADNADFQTLRAKFPIMATWDDHDYGFNDAGREFPFRRYAEKIHETFWGLGDTEAVDHDGVYYSKTFGPEGQRTQVIMLDTRFFRSALTLTDDRNAPGKERYMPTDDPDQALLGEAQWTWLEEQLRQPADVRIVASSIQVMTTDGHGYEHWNNFPLERDRLYSLIDDTNATGVVFVSGDRHTGFLYEADGRLPYTAHELTASSLNMSFRDTSDEKDSAQIGAGVAVVHYGDLSIDWDNRAIAMKLRGVDNAVLAENTLTFDEIGL